MTRKCVLCKETNYRNTYSFFSAPKDPETRKKWQAAIAIENYAVTNDTYVCSKHFHKNDIITHWVSGVPPHVITIKYKKCRLRPGAVPGKHFHLQTDLQTNENDHSDIYDLNDFLTFPKDFAHNMDIKKENFLIPREEHILDSDTENDSKKMISKSQHFSIDEKYAYASESSKRSIKIESSENDTSNTNSGSLDGLKTYELNFNINKCSKSHEEIAYSNDRNISDTIIYENSNLENIPSKERKVCEEFSHSKPDKIDYLSNVSNFSEDDTSTETWEHDNVKNNTYVKEKYLKNTLKTVGTLYIQDQGTLSNDQLDKHMYTIYDQICENEMLFEDLLEMCTEVVLPHGWSCVVTSKGHTTTIVYLNMKMTKTGIPFIERQVFIKSDMILRCSASNQEINPFIHNLLREGKHDKILSLLDIEEFIDEFDQRTLCEGLNNEEDFEDHKTSKIVYKDGIKWRHVLCPLIVNNDSSKCTRCIALSHILTSRCKRLVSVPYGSIIFLREQKKFRTLRKMKKRIKEHTSLISIH